MKLFTKTHYLRDNKGQYVGGISIWKAYVLATALLTLSSCFLASVIIGRTASADANSAGSAQTVASPEAKGCVHREDGIWDCTDDHQVWLKWQKFIKDEAKKGKEAKVTAYTSRVQETDATPCIAADGSDICKRYAKGEKICASNDYKIGTRLHVETLGTCVVSDRMNSRYTGSGRIDWYMGMDLTSARTWGAKTVVVTVK